MQTEVFHLDPTLNRDSFLICNFRLCELRLFNRKELLWLILVPRVNDVTELYQLNERQLELLIFEINLVSKILKKDFSCDKLNIATLGNFVPQLHIHVIARRFDDLFWPQPAFGLVKEPYDSEGAKVVIEKIQALVNETSVDF